MLAISLLPALSLRVEQTRVDAAVRKGVEYLRTVKTQGVNFAKIDDSFELAHLTRVSTGGGENDVAMARHCNPTWDASFAILFLRKATQRLVVSEDLARGGQ
jgi:hypothetical protein